MTDIQRDGIGRFSEHARSGAEVTLDGAKHLYSHGGEEDDTSWPPPPAVAKYRVEGTLAARVQNYFQSDKAVYLESETTYGGYSEWTQENETEFTVRCGNESITVTPDASETDWNPSDRYDSVYARFDAFLAAYERPVELFNEWFSLDEAQEGFNVRPDTILSRRLPLGARLVSVERNGALYWKLTGSAEWMETSIAFTDDEAADIVQSVAHRWMLTRR